MEILHIKNKPGVKVFIFTDKTINLEDKYKIVENFSKKIPEIKNIGYAGYNSRINMKYHIDWIIYGNDPTEFKYKKIEIKTLSNLIETLLEKCSDVLKNDQLHIFIFPTISEFVIKKMSGSSGFNTNEGTITVGLYPSKNWKHNFKGTLAHEIAHALAKFSSLDELTIGERLVSDGIAENFRDAFVKGESPPWTRAISKKEAKSILKDIETKLNSADLQLHNQIFHGAGKYPLWAGYTIGYYIINDYLKKQSIINWRKILKTPLKEILKEVI